MGRYQITFNQNVGVINQVDGGDAEAVLLIVGTDQDAEALFGHVRSPSVVTARFGIGQLGTGLFTFGRRGIRR